MQKDIIYIDVDDDITALIGKVKDAKEKVVALVPPKRIGVLQSAVNLRLLERAAGQQNKKLVLITGSTALSSLAAAAKIPVAKNLQSRPELGEIAALDIDDGDDIIDGSQLPVGEHAKQAAETVSLDAAAADVISDSDAINIDREVPKASAPGADEALAKPHVKKLSKVPNFNNFRKKFLIFGGLGILLIAFLVWAIFFAGRATVFITAETTDASVNDSVTLTTSGDTDPSKKLLRSTTQELQKDVSIDFNATGTKNIGDKATGQVTMRACVASTTPPSDVPAGTIVSTGGNNYTTQSAASFSQGSFGNGCLNYSSNAVAITAAEGGVAYNVSNANFAIDGRDKVTASGSTSGGTDKVVKVVTKGDVASAQQKLNDQDTDSVKTQLAGQFDKGSKVVDDTFKADTSKVKANPGVGDEADGGTATLSGSITYTMSGISKDELSKYLDDYFKEQLKDQTSQRVYDNGASSVSFTNVDTGKTVTAQLTADGKIGPKIEDQKVKKLAEGKRYGEIQSSLQSIQGVSNVDVKFWPFWVSHAPNNPDRIDVKFKVNGDK